MKIKFKNFALFDDSNTFELSPLTFLIGGNNCGKSTFIKGLEAIGNGVLDDSSKIKMGKKDFTSLTEVFKGLYRKQSFERSSYEEGYTYYERSFNFVNSQDKDILKVSYFEGEKAKENVVFYVNRFLELLDESGYKIIDEEVSIFLKGYSEIKKNIKIKDDSQTRDVFEPNHEIANLERWFFEVGVLQLFEFECFEEHFKNKIINLFIECFKPFTFWSVIKSENNEIRYWNNSRKLLNIDSIKNSDLSEPKDIYNYNDFIIKNLTFPSYITSDNVYDTEFRDFWMKRFFGNENPLSIEKFKDIFFEVKLNNRLLTEQGSGITKILQYILYFSTLTSEVGHGFSILSQNLYKSENERQEFLLNFRKSESINRKNIIYIEEPEVNLHPNFQIILAEMIFELSINSLYYFVIETHSEYIIRKLQLLIAKNKNTPTDLISILNFGSDTNLGKVKTIHIDRNGSLSESFYPGFFDLSQDLQYQLMLANRSIQN
jgi:predicted ATP-dependent endonuclease of OLD family